MFLLPTVLSADTEMRSKSMSKDQTPIALYLKRRRDFLLLKKHKQHQPITRDVGAIQPPEKRKCHDPPDSTAYVNYDIQIVVMQLS